MIRHVAIAALALVFSTSIASAQLDTTASDVLVLDHDFTGTGEFARATLVGYEVYRAELSTADAVIEVYPIKGGQPVFINPEEASAASGGAMFTLYPTETKEYQFRLRSGGPVVRLKVYRDVKRSKRRAKVLATPGWEIGAEIGIGGHSGYLLNTATADVEDSESGGLDIEGCFSARSGPGILSGVTTCAFGIGYDKRGSAPGVVWFFIEPRIRILGGKERGVTNSEIGVLGRASYGLLSGANRNPKMLTVGAYASHNIRKNKDGKGFSVTLAYRHGWISNLGFDGGGIQFRDSNTNRVSFAVGYYQ